MRSFTIRAFREEFSEIRAVILRCLGGMLDTLVAISVANGTLVLACRSNICVRVVLPTVMRSFTIRATREEFSEIRAVILRCLGGMLDTLVAISVANGTLVLACRSNIC